MKKMILLLLALTPLLFSQEVNPKKRELPPGVRVVRNIPYVTGGGLSQQLDLYLPEVTPNSLLPVVVKIHGGSWKKGDKADCSTVSAFVPRGYIGVSINYRLSGEAIFPAQIEDCKSAIRWLRANALKLRIDPNRIGVWGTSAGGHLAALLGTSGEAKEFDQGENLQYSSKVEAVCDFFGPTDFIKEDDEVSFEKCNRVDSSVCLLFGGLMSDNPETCVAASPISYVSANNPPFLILHGDKDTTVPINQSELLNAALIGEGVPVTFQVIDGGHGGAAFETPEVNKTVALFFDKYLKQNISLK